MIITMSSGSKKKSVAEYIKKLTLVAESAYDSNVLKQIVAMLAADPVSEDKSEKLDRKV